MTNIFDITFWFATITFEIATMTFENSIFVFWHTKLTFELLILICFISTSLNDDVFDTISLEWLRCKNLRFNYSLSSILKQICNTTTNLLIQFVVDRFQDFVQSKNSKFFCSQWFQMKIWIFEQFRTKFFDRTKRHND